MEVDDPITSRPPGSRASRLQQRRREQQAGTDSSSAQPHQERIELPRDPPREPAHRTRPDERRVGAIDDATSLLGIDIWKTASRQTDQRRYVRQPPKQPALPCVLS